MTELLDEISGNGMMTIEGEEVDIVSYSLTVAPKAGPLIAEGSISGSEELMRKVKKAKFPKLILEDGPSVMLRCLGGHNGMRWVKAFRL
jgi:hypothetical protein